jgi:hypothetical protein
MLRHPEHRPRNPRRSPGQPHRHRQSQHPAPAPSHVARIRTTTIPSIPLII